MLRIEVKTDELAKSTLIIDGLELESSEAEFSRDEKRLYGFITCDSDAERLISYRFSEVAPYFVTLSLPSRVTWNKYLESAEILFTGEDGHPANSITFEGMANVEHWANPYSVTEYVEALQSAARETKSGIVFEPHSSSFDTEHRFDFICHIRSMDSIIGEEISFWREQLRALCHYASNLLLKQVRKDSLLIFFDFPPAIKIPCEQYLLYFVQFLEDLGIKANSEIKEEAGRILFSVTPADGPNALGKIKDALEAYLDLPRNPEFNATAGEFSDMAISQLKANVFFLKSQLALAHAMLETKNATIEALKFTAFQQRQLLTGPGLSESVQESKNDSEPIVGDTVHLTKYEGKFLKVDLPTILRRLKRSFGIGPKRGDVDS